jgi:hypothetical protein
MFLKELLIADEAVKADDQRLHACDLIGKDLSTGGEFVTAHVRSAVGGAFDQISQPQAEFDHAPILLRRQWERTKAGGVQGPPEAVRGTRVVVSLPGGVASRIDTHKEDIGAVREVIG